MLGSRRSCPWLEALLILGALVGAFLGASRAARAAAAEPVISEILYHPPDEGELGEFVELWNPGEQAVDLGGWKLSGAITAELAAGTRLEKDSRLVLVRNVERFTEQHGAAVKPAGTFRGSLKNGGGEIQLVDATGRIVDSVRFSSKAPWPQGAAGLGSSLERICPSTPARDAEFWAPSAPPAAPGDPPGSPGLPNGISAPYLPPVVSHVEWAPRVPGAGEPIRVEAIVSHNKPLASVELVYRTAREGEETEELRVRMEPQAQKVGAYVGQIPAREPLRLVRFRIVAQDSNGVGRSEPSPNDVHPAYSLFIRDDAPPSQIPHAYLFHVDAEESQQTQGRLARGTPGGGGPEQMALFERTRIERKLSLAEVWSAFFCDERVSQERLEKLRAVLREEDALRRKTADEILRAADLQERAEKGYVDEIAAADARLKKALAPALESKDIARAMATRKEAAKSRRGGFGVDVTVREMFQLDPVAFFVAARTEVDARGLEAFRKAFVELRGEENKFVEEIKKKMASGVDPFSALSASPGDLRGKALDAARKAIPATDRAKLSRWSAQTAQDVRGFGPAKPSAVDEAQGRGNAAFCVVDPDGRVEVYDHVHAPARAGGFKVKLLRDRPMRFRDAFSNAEVELRTVNLVFEFNPRFVLAEALAYEVYRQSGVPAPATGHVRLWVDGHELGYHLVVEQPNRSFLRRNHRDDHGNLYKVLWYGRGVVDQHEKKTPAGGGHEDLLEILKLLDEKKGEEQWQLIDSRFQVDEVINYFAVSSCISNWDGFFNNYFAYDDVKGSGKWEIYPWDEDKTWGFYDGLGRTEVFHDMPLDYGADGSAPPGGVPQGGPGNRGQFRGFVGNATWWRPPGYFSGPFLANPQVKDRYVRRLGEILRKIYTEEAFFPVIDALERRLEPEVAWRAKALKLDEAAELQGFRDDLGAIRKHLTERRRFLLGRKELGGSGE